ncbi:MAG TPA: O-antigen ligase family protein [Solirubrobacterales bacterium]|nr:O-antigen ligase family protein [Solirubrobacterales bacterium]
MSGLLASIGVLIAAGASAAAILLPPARPRAIAMLAALALFPILILGDQWHSAEIVDLRDHPMRFAGLGSLALALTVSLAVAFRRRPPAFPLAAVAVLPFRVPLEAGGDTANLLVPLYLVIAGGAMASAIRDWGLRPAGPVAAGDPPPLPVAKASSGVVPPTAPPAGVAVQWLTRILAVVVLLYAVQTLYSPDFSKSLQNVCFFFVPFSLLFGLLRDVEWSRKLLTWALVVLAVEAVVFVLIGSVEWLTRELFWNDQVIRSNDFHTYFRVNSVFWDPNIYGRYLALVIVIAMAALLWVKERKSFWLLTGLIAVLWIGLVPTFSQSSFAALLGGLAVLAALRWSWRWTLGAVGVAAVLGVLIVFLVGGVRPNVDTGGRANLVSGGIELFKQRPLWGYGSGSFPKAYTEHVKSDSPVSVSHTEPITVAAEQGLVGLVLYAALLMIALWTMSTGLWRRVGGLPPSSLPPAPRSVSSPSQAGTDIGVREEDLLPAHPSHFVARAAVLAAFVALLIHTMAYAGFYEDPIAWVLLAVGASLSLAACRDTSAA